MPYIYIPSRNQNVLLCLIRADNITNIAEYYSYNSFSVINIATQNSIYFSQLHWYDLQCVLAGFLKKEIEKADIHVSDTGENPEAPHPREMIDLEVS